MKLRLFDIYSVAASISVILLAYAFFYHFVPNQTKASYQKEYIQQLQDEAYKLPLAKKRLKQTEKTIEEMAAQWQSLVLQKTPPQSVKEGGIDLSVNRWQLTADVRKFRDRVQKNLNLQLKKGGVLVLKGPQIPFPSSSASTIIESYFNYPAIPFPVTIFDLGQVMVEGTLDQLSLHMKAWNDMSHFFAITDGLKFLGTSPKIIATYNLSLVGFIRGHHIAPQVPEDPNLAKTAPAARRRK